MTEDAVMRILVGVVLALVGVVYATLREQNRHQGADIASLKSQNKDQEVAIGRLTERMIARETAHAEHRETMMTRLDRFERKLDEALRSLPPRRRETPYESTYSQTTRKDEPR